MSRDSDSSKKVSCFELKLILVGDSGVGKSSLLSRYMNEVFTDQPCTIIPDFKIKKINIDSFTSVKITIWDTCGQEKYRSITKNYFNDADGIILIYDVCDRKSFENLDKWIRDIKENSNKGEISTILCGNKIDIKPRNTSYEEGNNFAIDNGLLYCETSSKEGININIAFENIVKDILDKINKEKIFEEEVNKNTSLSTSLRAVRGKERENSKRCC